MLMGQSIHFRVVVTFERVCFLLGVEKDGGHLKHSKQLDNRL